MSRNTLPVLAVLAILLYSHCKTAQPEAPWIDLFNGADLQGWDTYLGPKFIVRDTGGVRQDSVPVGLNTDPDGVFSVVSVDGEPAIRISGTGFGGISTTGEFENYHLRLQFKWGQLKSPPRDQGKMDSGVLYHAVGPHGADYGYWMRSQEFQIQEGDCADYWGVAGGLFDIPATLNADSAWVYDPKGQLQTFSADGPNGRHCIKNPDTEKPTGEWNTIDLYCSGDTAVHMVNGVVNMVLYRSRQSDEGRETPLVRGKIQLQSEGAEVYYRRIQVQAIERLPAGLGGIEESEN